MDFTREPIIQTVITPKEGCKLVVRSSKSAGQEEYFVDALEIVAFGNALFFRSLERPKSFLVPATDYEVLEVREARMVLKNVGVERTIKIGGGKAAKEQQSQEKLEPVLQQEATFAAAPAETPVSSEKGDARGADKKRDKRRHTRRRRGREDEATEEAAAVPAPEGVEGVIASVTEERKPESPLILPPPATLISETIARYKDNALFKSAFYVKEEAAATGESPKEGVMPQEGHPEDILEALSMQDVSLEPSEYGTLGLVEEEQASNWQLPFPETNERNDER